MSKNRNARRDKYGAKRECETCHGYGLFAMGDSTAMGPMDANDGMPTKPCPECNADHNPAKAGAK